MWRACNLTAFTTCLTGPVDYQFASCPEGPGFNLQGVTRCDWSLWLVWGGLRPKPLLGRRANNVIILLDLTQLSCPGFTLAACPPSSFTTDIVGCWVGALWRACNLTAFTPHLTGPVVHPFASCPEGPGFNLQGGTLWNRDSPVSLSRYNNVFENASFESNSSFHHPKSVSRQLRRI